MKVLSQSLLTEVELLKRNKTRHILVKLNLIEEVLNYETKIPTLFISGTLDVRTPPSNAEAVRKGFKTSEHLIIDGAVHSDPLFVSSPKIKNVMIEFMKGQKISTYKIELPPLKFIQMPEKTLLNSLLSDNCEPKKVSNNKKRFNFCCG